MVCPTKKMNNEQEGSTITKDISTPTENKVTTIIGYEDDTHTELLSNGPTITNTIPTSVTMKQENIEHIRDGTIISDTSTSLNQITEYTVNETSSPQTHSWNNILTNSVNHTVMNRGVIRLGGNIMITDTVNEITTMTVRLVFESKKQIMLIDSTLKILFVCVLFSLSSFFIFLLLVIWWKKEGSNRSSGHIRERGTYTYVLHIMFL
jgi:hypothetical protein